MAPEGLPRVCDNDVVWTSVYSPSNPADEGYRKMASSVEDTFSTPSYSRVVELPAVQYDCVPQAPNRPLLASGLGGVPDRVEVPRREHSSAEGRRMSGDDIRPNHGDASGVEPCGAVPRSGSPCAFLHIIAFVPPPYTPALFAILLFSLSPPSPSSPPCC